MHAAVQGANICHRWYVSGVIIHFLNCRMSCVHVGITISGSLVVTSEVPKGSSPGPSVFVVQVMHDLTCQVMAAERKNSSPSSCTDEFQYTTVLRPQSFRILFGVSISSGASVTLQFRSKV